MLTSEFQPNVASLQAGTMSVLVCFPLMPVLKSADSSVSTLTNEVSSENPPKHPSEIKGNREGNRQLTVIGPVGDAP